MRRRWLGWILVIAVVVVGLLGWGARTRQPARSHARVSLARGKRAQPRPIKNTKVAASAGHLTRSQAETQIDQLIAAHHIMGTLLFTTNGPAGVHVRTYGYADLAHRQKNTVNEAYPLASLQKPLTGALIQLLINDGRLTMQTKLSQYYPQVPHADQITVRQLLDHRSGIQMVETTPKRVLASETDQIDFTLRHLVSTGNHQYCYTNANFTLLAGIVRAASGQSYQTYLRQNILQPLRLKHSYAYDDIPGNAINPASYRLAGSQTANTVISKPLQSSELGCGSLYMSVGDYYRFMQALQSGKLLGAVGLQNLTSNFTPRYSAGVYYQPDGRIRVGGNDNGFHTYYMGTRDARTALVLFENQGSFGLDDQVAEQIQRILLRLQA
ncbi:serine hydrolase domain-containing protein [Lactiplantibacillus modestisalitolerans]|uniref:Serine hydrolase domain-containing protein n=1 Tax=Lactiplantibacillus modestisalitolerans TaxID=1457219 RepID=A0ABV5WVE2_9LACO|nr:serine hydrolase domain-containing protein [Lactiplantibacillus modestisalitolerans]